MSEKESGMKIIDRRMFTPEGELREEFSFLEKTEVPPTPAPPAADEPSPPPEPPAPRAVAAQEGETPGGPPLELPGMPPGMGRPTFLDLVAMVAEGAAVYLGEAALPDGSSGEDPRMARLHIELLDVLREKSQGNLSAQESTVLEDILYQLRTRYVRKHG